MTRSAAGNDSAGGPVPPRTRRLLIAACLLFAALTAFRLADLFNTRAAGISLCTLEAVALAYHLRVATNRRLPSAVRRPFRFTSAALALLIIAGVGFSIAFTTGDKSWGPATVLAVVPRTLVVPVLLMGLLSFATEPMDRRARWKLTMDVTTVLGAGVMLMWYLVLGPALQSGDLLNPLGLGAVVFAVGDVVLLVGVGAVLLIDLNGFKQVNDSYGHEVGDQLLVAFADVLRRACRGTDTPARLGGDEFAVVLPGTRDGTGVAERILDACVPRLNLAGHTLQLRASIGIAVAQRGPSGATDDLDASELLHRADLAMYAAKRRGTPSWVRYSAEAMDAAPAAAPADDLAAAVKDGQLRLRYQPIVDPGTGDLVAVEPVVQWQHPTRGLLGPDDFVAGRDADVGAWVLREASRQVGRWQADLPAGRTLHLSVTLPATEPARPALADDVLRELDRTGFDPRNLILGIAPAGDPSAAAQLERLRARGVRVAPPVAGPLPAGDVEALLRRSATELPSDLAGRPS
ncbi:diguanylate cyclase [Dactylosporangium sp. NPDC005555]|uniref:diguanylate cyclase domain-containing protein n=1 Tax=Dactylosporangium sp. NPDC005555 TaxID=3154889 RepID=UPI0033AEE4EE